MLNLLILLGCPGASKGTQARLLDSVFSKHILSAGDTLRDYASGKCRYSFPLYPPNEIKKILSSGLLVPEQLTYNLLSKKLRDLVDGIPGDLNTGFSNDANKVNINVILEGYPRSLQQAEYLLQWQQEPRLNPNRMLVIHLKPPSFTDVKLRLQGRLIHNKSGRTYHPIYNPPRIPGKDDITGENLERRDDDMDSNSIEKRFKIFLENTPKVLNFLRSHQQQQQLNSFIVEEIEQSSIQNMHKAILEIIERVWN